MACWRVRGESITRILAVQTLVCQVSSSPVEAKEGLAGRHDGRILASVTLQRFLRGYPRLCGMTGTARDCAGELRDTYGLDVVVVPTNRSMLRADRPDVVFGTREAKELAVVDEIRRVTRTGRPVLVGTLTVEESERLSERLRGCGVSCHVLNAKNPAAEAAIVANAGAPGEVTISTNMAGRGTDIRLGGDHKQDREQVAALGGLYVIGTNQHESHRIDLQLRGRAGRQGDAGLTRSGSADLRRTGPCRCRNEGSRIDMAYMVNDDPFRHQIGALLTGAGGATVAIYSAAISCRC